MKTLEKLLSFTETDENGCMIWTRGFTTCGYPRIYHNGNGNVRVNRLVCELHTGEDLTNKVVRHTCDNPKCINPDHLISGSCRDNVEDRVLRGRSHNHVSQLEIESVKALRDQGFTYKRISAALGIKYKRVEYIIKRLLGM